MERVLFCRSRQLKIIITDEMQYSHLRSIENLSAASSQTAGGFGLSSSNLSGSISSNLASVGVTNWDKLPSFNAKLKSKSSNALFGSWKSRVSKIFNCMSIF